MSSLDFELDFDRRVHDLEREGRGAIEINKVAQTLDDDVSVGFFERSWFGAIAAAEAAERDLCVLHEAMERLQDSVCQAQVKLTELAALRDALGSELEGRLRVIVARPFSPYSGRALVG